MALYDYKKRCLRFNRRIMTDSIKNRIKTYTAQEVRELIYKFDVWQAEQRLADISYTERSRLKREWVDKHIK